MNLCFYVYNPTTGYTKFPHKNRESAELEAARLARENPGQKFQVLAVISQCIKNDVTWERVDSGEIPF